MSLRSKHFGKYLYIGCGNHRMSMFTHADINLGKNKKGNPDIFCDITKHIPLPNDHVDLIFSRGTMEHLIYSEFINCLIENYRILKIGGAVRMSLPDFDVTIHNYMNNLIDKYHNDEMEKWDLYYRMPRNGVAENFINRMLYHDHFYLHNFHTVSKALTKCGFINVRKVNPGETIAKEISQILKEAEGKSDGQILDGQILIEAQKGPNPPTLKMLIKPLPNNFISKILAKYFNIRITGFDKRQGIFPEKKWFYEKKVILYQYFIKKFQNNLKNK